ncbi:MULTISPECIES: RNA polymerase factor sigma-54 [Dehalobacter]|jgi:RNA polymerase sigma-54 factor|uniref:RNA polymerase sigma-54 subunit RpoN n=1 Tax=Dehalobacter restrictus (strain DSM 9455 / PER-K23) TaxID=871738 RepID=A0ABM5P7V5_DEHRP|nr:MULTISPECIES: RNA polymerase factor sigma-54 [Dehalobacter]AHF10705.1 RNA polymerase sigma-54 subunit RpoN [Dehalobacter restrictus DSM 9455]MCG1026322.1 RNA polymerase factor sigma-54 [Dehalobacter sp.]OCZ54688.1 RNA polymerase sigma-54 factor [Dehalobacter sp. TeCB1]
MRQIRQDIFLEQQQRLFMTTELRQAISVLQMSTLELSEYITKKIEENPFLDEDEPVAENNEVVSKTATRVNMDDLIEHFSSDSNMGHIWNEKNENDTGYEQYLSDRPSLYEQLELQLNLEIKNPADIIIGNFLIGSIDRNGYFTTELEYVSQKLNVAVERVEEVLKVIHTFYPTGVGARNLQECMLLQMRANGKDSELAEQVIQNYFQELADKKIMKIANTLSVSTKQVQEVYDLIRMLDPKPGLQFGAERNPFIWPDVTIMRDQNDYMVIVNDFDFNYLRINQTYVDILRNSNALSDDVKKYLEEKFDSALGLIRGIEQRRLNIYKVVQSIVDIQREFFDNGIEYLKPLTMSQVADLVGIHESTVSRVTCNKYVQTPRGLFALKYFFNSGVGSYDCDKISSKSVKHLIQDIINKEDPNQPLSDQDIMMMLVNKGMRISRRTVNKYRQSMGIPTNLHRKRY